MRCSALLRNSDGAIAPTVALSLVALIAAGGVAFDYARLATMDTELQQAADQAALAGASQLDGKASAATRAVLAAQSLLQNRTYFASDGGGQVIQTGISDVDGGGNATRIRITFYEKKSDAEADTGGFTATATNADARAKFVKVEVSGRKARYAFTPIVGAFDSGVIEAAATAGLGSAICKVPPVMICNPDEPAANGNEDLAFSVSPGVGLRLITGNADAPGNFGWLQSGLDPGASALAAALGYNSPPGDCQPITGVTTETGMSTSVINALNTRFDVFANGNQTCPSQGGGICSPSPNTRKDVVCKPNNTNTNCNNDTWGEANSPYHPPSSTVCVPKPNGNGCNNTTVYSASDLPTDGSADPSTMGYPRDLCHSVPRDEHSCGGSGSNHIKGDGDWDRDAYFRVNYKKSGGGSWTNGTGAGSWQANTGLSATATRWQVYQWELAHLGNTIDGVVVNAPKVINANEAAFSRAVRAGAVGASSTQADRRRMTVAVLNCQALELHGKRSGVSVATWLDVFLVEPALNRPANGGGPVWTDQKDVYVEEIGVAQTGFGVAGQVVRRDLPYLVR